MQLFTKQVLMSAKITFVLLLAASLQITARGLAQKVTLEMDHAPLKTVMDSISRQTGYLFFYQLGQLKQSQPVTIHAQDADMRGVLFHIFAHQPFAYSIANQTIVLTTKKSDDNVNGTPALNDVTIHVTDSLGQPLAGASVLVRGTKNGGTTDPQGNLTLKGLKGGETLVISYIGYISKEVRVNENTSLQIILLPKTNKLNQLTVEINKGYYTTTQELNTGNVSIVSAKDIAKQPVGNPLAALQGRVPGLSIIQRSGVPGTIFSIRLRGQNSIANGNDPLIIVDGIPFTSTTLNSVFSTGAGAIDPLNSMDLTNIESIEVLKDADATAIYGSRGANGVILITTKKGHIGKSKIDINFSQGVEKVSNTLDMLNTTQYLKMRREAFANDNSAPHSWDYDINGTWDTTRYTDWQDFFIGGAAHITNFQASLNGGNVETQFNLGGDYRKESTVFPGNFFDGKTSFHIGLKHKSSNGRFMSKFSSMYTNDVDQMPTLDLTQYISLAPNAPPLYNADGSLNWQGGTFENPLATLYQKSKAITNNLLGNLFLKYQILKGLNIETSLGYNKIEMHQDVIIPLKSYPPSWGATANNRIHRYANNTVQSWIVEPQISYEVKIGPGKLNILIGSSFQNKLQDRIAQFASNFSSDDLIDDISAASANIAVDYLKTQYRYSGLYGRIGYNWKNKYILNLTARRDGSSNFGPGNQFGNFGSGGIAWIFSKEKFISENLSFLSFGKLRASYGSTGNDQLTPYQYLSTYSSLSYSYLGLNGLYPTRLTNPNFGWELVKKLEIAANFGFVNNKINISANWYRNRTGNQLVGYPLPTITGFNSVQYNLPAVIENNGLELILSSSNIHSNTLSWTTSLNISFPKSRLVSYPNIEGSPYASLYAIGKSMFVENRFQFLGINPETGLYTFKDMNNDGNYTYEDDRHFVFIGQDFFGGFGNELQYNQFSLSFFFQFVRQKGLVYLSNSWPGNFNSNQPKVVLNHWQNKGDKNKLLQKYTTTYNSEYGLFSYSDGLIGDASFIRLKNVSFTWHANKSLIKKLKLQDLELYIQGQNIFTITRYKWLDPETGGNLTLPPLRIINTGIQISL